VTPRAAKRVVEGLKAAGVDFISFLPESRLSDIIPLLEEEKSITLVRASHEGSAVSIATGAALVGKKPAVYMEGTGVFLSTYNLQSAAIRVGAPVVLLVAHVGSPGDKANSITFSGYGNKMEALLQALAIPYCVAETEENIETKIADVVRAAQSSNHPACLLFTGEFTVFTGGWT
jgi:sulfopyruvate decarboxylase subunit alpha